MGRYLYSIANGNTKLSFGHIGLEESLVYSIPYKDIMAIVHLCSPKPYETDDEDKAKSWVLEHSYVIDRATNEFGTVLPFSFDVIIKGDDLTVKNWIQENYIRIKKELENVENKAEYSIQIFYDHDTFGKKIVEVNKELEDLKEKINSMPQGTAYLYQRKYELSSKKLILEEIDLLSQEFSSIIMQYVGDMKIDKKVSWVPERYKDKELMMAFACLVHHEKIDALGDALEEINNREGFAVRFTGPWAPFSFARLQEV